MPWHGNSEYAHAGHFRPMSRAARMIWRQRLGMARRHGAITATTYFVADELLKMHGPDGRCHPTLDTIARRARCARRTVVHALASLRDCGLIEWTRRIVRTAAGARQTSNAYRLAMAALDRLRQRRKPECKSHTGTPASMNPISMKAAPPPNATLADLGLDRAEAAEAARKTREARQGIVAAPRPTLQNAAEIRAAMEARRIAQWRASRTAPR